MAKRIKWANHPAPPLWLRHFVSWRILGWIDQHSDYCWANMVSWKLGSEVRTWYPSRMCFDNGDYCGKFNGKPIPETDNGPMIIWNGKQVSDER